MKAFRGREWEALGGVLVSRSCKIRSSSTSSFYDDPVSVSYRDPGMKVLVTVFYRSL
jgi:hypothetical protein